MCLAHLKQSNLCWSRMRLTFQRVVILYPVLNQSLRKAGSGSFSDEVHVFCGIENCYRFQDKYSSS